MLKRRGKRITGVAVPKHAYTIYIKYCDTAAYESSRSVNPMGSGISKALAVCFHLCFILAKLASHFPELCLPQILTRHVQQGDGRLAR